MIRYNYRTDNPWFGNGFVQHSEGEWVKHKDVESMGIAFADCIAENARLKAEVERLRSSSFVTAVPIEQYERLRKAGDAMERSLSFAYPDSPKIKDWNAAKEGKPNA